MPRSSRIPALMLDRDITARIRRRRKPARALRHQSAARNADREKSAAATITQVRYPAQANRRRIWACPTSKTAILYLARRPRRSLWIEMFRSVGHWRSCLAESMPDTALQPTDAITTIQIIPRRRLRRHKNPPPGGFFDSKIRRAAAACFF